MNTSQLVSDICHNEIQEYAERYRQATGRQVPQDYARSQTISVTFAILNDERLMAGLNADLEPIIGQLFWQLTEIDQDFPY